MEVRYVKLESASFTIKDIPGFTSEMILIDAAVTARRIREASRRMLELAALVPEEPPAGGPEDEWSAKEVLAHIAVFSRGWGALGYMVAKGRIQDLDVESVISQRDTLGEDMARRPVAEIAAEAAERHRKTLAFLEQATVEELTRTYRHEYGESSAESIFRLPVASHLEQHVEQLERALTAAGIQV